jgi:hypothetical protein
MIAFIRAIFYLAIGFTWPGVGEDVVFVNFAMTKVRYDT